MQPLPPQPKLKDFPGHEYGYNEGMFVVATRAWEKVCEEILKRSSFDPLH